MRYRATSWYCFLFVLFLYSNIVQNMNMRFVVAVVSVRTIDSFSYRNNHAVGGGQLYPPNTLWKCLIAAKHPRIV